MRSTRGNSGRPNERRQGGGFRGDRQGRPAQDRRRAGSDDRTLGGEQVEGRRAVRELLVANRRRVRDVWVADGTASSELLDEIEDLCRQRHIALHRVSNARISSSAKSESPQGVIAHAEALPEVDLDELFAARDGRAPFLLAFDGVTDPHNLGSLVRTGECVGVTGVILPKHRSVHVSPTVTKASAGAVEHVPIAVVPGIPAALKECKEAGLWTVALDPDGEVDIDELAVADQPIVLVFGAEGAGLSRLTKERCDVRARIPQQGSVASLNVAAAGAIACYSIARRR